MMTRQRASERHRSHRRGRRRASMPTFISTCRAICRLSLRPISTRWPRRCGPSRRWRWRRWRRRSSDAEEWHNPNVVKVVCDARGDALYFSRSPIPYARDGGAAGAGAAAYRGVRLSARFPAAASPRSSRRARAAREARTVARAGARVSHPGGGSVAPSLEVDTPRIWRAREQPAAADEALGRRRMVEREARPSSSSSPAAWSRRSARGWPRHRSARCWRRAGLRSRCSRWTRTSMSTRAR